MSSQEFKKSVEEKYIKIGFDKLTDIQKNSYSKIVKEENVLLIAPTGSGKTEAAIIPVIMGSINHKKKNKVSAIYITPLKALNRDIFRRVIKYAEDEGLRVNIRHGDTTRLEKQKITKEPPDVLITTPETLGIMIGNKSTREILTDTKYVIIDEFHELIGNERGTHLTLSLERLQELKESITNHCLNAAEKIRSESLLTKSITIFIRTSPFQKMEIHYSNSKTIDFPIATDNSIEIVKSAIFGLKSIFKKGYKYQKSGIVLSGLCESKSYNDNLFSSTKDKRTKNLMRSIDYTNFRYGRSTLSLAVALSKKKWKTKKQYFSKIDTTNFDCLPTVKIS